MVRWRALGISCPPSFNFGPARIATTDDALLLALGLAQQWSEHWVEAALPAPEPWGIVVQQILAATLERGQWAPHELQVMLQLHGAFPELAASDLAMLIDHLVAESYLVMDAGLLQIGPTTETKFGRSHCLDLLASFSGSSLLTGRHGSAEVGFIDPTVLTGEKVSRLLLLGGRSWRVTEIEWSKRTVWLEPAKEGGTARWIGGGRSLGADVCGAIRHVLVNGSPPGITLSKRAIAKLDDLRDEIPVSSPKVAITRDPSGSSRWWTFAGTNANRTYAKLMGTAAVVRRFDALGLDFSMVSNDLLLPNLEHAELILYDAELKQASKGIKFSECLPDTLLSRVVVARLYEVGEVE